MSRIFPDSKTFIDLAMINNPDLIVSSFDKSFKSNNLNTEDLQSFVKRNFLIAHETKPANLNSFKSKSIITQNITNFEMRDYAEDVIRSFLKLGRFISVDVRNNPEKYSTIFLPNAFIVLEENKDEITYFESFWIIQTLLSLEEFDIARGMLDNLIFMVKQFGYIPLGNRVYYLNRTHPPLLTKSARMYVEKTKDKTWLKNNIKYLDEELNFWLNTLITIYVDSIDYIVAVYPPGGVGPRPEFYYEDVKTASSLKNNTEKQKLYKQLRKASQSGFESPSRWIFNNSKKKSLTNVSRVVPVDLNAFLYEAFNDLSKLYNLLKMNKPEKYWKAFAVILKDAITNVFYDKIDGIWYDYDLKLKIKRKKFFVSGLTPLWAKAYPRSSTEEKNVYGEKVVKFLNKIRNTSSFDFKFIPAPYQSIIIDGLKDTLNEKAVMMAENLAKSWMSNIQTDNTLGKNGEFILQKGNELKNVVVLDYVIKKSLAERKELSNFGNALITCDVKVFIFIFLVILFG
nr:trehalase-like [Onthophagus taurus]